MNISIKQLRKLIREAMYDPSTLPKSKIPKSMIGLEKKEDRQKLSDYSSTDKESYHHAEDLIDVFDGKPAVIDMHGGYERAAKIGHNKKLEAYRSYLHNVFFPSMDAISQQISSGNPEKVDLRKQYKNLQADARNTITAIGLTAAEAQSIQVGARLDYNEKLRQLDVK